MVEGSRFEVGVEGDILRLTNVSPERGVCNWV